MKRFRDENGRLTIRTDEVARLTLYEANAYYADGAKYAHQGRIYTCNRFNDKDANGGIQEVIRFTSEDGYNLFVVPSKLGTWLPDVASDGLEISKVYA